MPWKNFGKSLQKCWPAKYRSYIMKFHILAIGNRMPAWINQGFQTYQKRFPKESPLILSEINASQQTNLSKAEIKKREATSLNKHIKSNQYIIALDSGGKMVTTEQLVTKLECWQMLGKDLCFIIGGAEGLTDETRKRANEILSLSALTFPHPLVRIMLAEQLYRAKSILQSHPYHR